MENAMVYMNLVLTFALGMLLAAVVAQVSTKKGRSVTEHELEAAIRREVRRELDRQHAFATGRISANRVEMRRELAAARQSLELASTSS